MDHWAHSAAANWGRWERPARPNQNGIDSLLSFNPSPLGHNPSASLFHSLQYEQPQSRDAQGENPAQAMIIDSHLDEHFHNDTPPVPPFPVPAPRPHSVADNVQHLEGHTASNFQRRRRKPPPSDAEWDRLKGDIEELYMVQRLSLAQTIKQMETVHHFSARRVPKFYRSEGRLIKDASERMYKDKFKTWHWSKYLPRDKATWMVQKANERQRPTMFRYGHQNWTMDRIMKSLDRTADGHDLPSLANLDKPTPNDITYCTPAVHPDTTLARHPEMNTPLSGPWTPAPIGGADDLDQGPSIQYSWRNMSIADLDKLVAEALKEDLKGNIVDAETKLLEALTGLKSVLSSTNVRTIRAGYLLTAFYGNQQRMNDADKVINWLSSAIVNRWGYKDRRTLVHFVQVVQFLQSWDRLEHARAMLYKLLDAWPEFEDGMPFDVPSVNAGSIVAAPENLEDIESSLFQESRDADRVNRQLDVANLWLTSGATGLERVLSRLILQCEKYPEELFVQTIQARCTSAQLHINLKDDEEARAILKPARSSLKKALKDANKVTRPILDLAKRVAFLYLHLQKYEACNEILERAAGVIERAITMPLTRDTAHLAIRFETAVGIEYQNHSSWKRARPWFERALALTIRALGPLDDEALKLERGLQSKRYQSLPLEDVDDLIGQHSGDIVVKFL